MKPKQVTSITCACCHASQEDPSPIRVGNAFVCQDCAKSGIILTRQEARTLRELLRCELDLMKDTLRDRGFSKRQHQVHRFYVRDVKRLERRLARLVRLSKK